MDLILFAVFTQAINLYLSHLPSLPVNSPVVIWTLIWDKHDHRFLDCWPPIPSPLGNSNQSVCILQINPPPSCVFAVGQPSNSASLLTVGCCHLLKQNSCSFIDCRSELGAAWKLSSRFCYLLDPWSQLFQLRFKPADPSVKRGSLECK